MSGVRNSSKLFSIVSKEIRKKHLKQDIKFIEDRLKSRECKLKQDYEKPESNSHVFYIYSNIHGNQFNFQEQELERLGTEFKYETRDLVKEITAEINSKIYSLWTKKKEFSSTPYFPLNKTILSVSLILILVLFLIAIFGQAFSNHFISETAFDAIEPFFYKIILSSMVLLIIISGFYLGNTLQANYEPFHYDKEIMRMLIATLRKYQQKAKELGLVIECDRQLTWIGFRLFKIISEADEESESEGIKSFNLSNQESKNSK